MFRLLTTRDATLVPGQARPDQTRPDQTRPHQTRQDETRPNESHQTGAQEAARPCRPGQARPDQTRSGCHTLMQMPMPMSISMTVPRRCHADVYARSQYRCRDAHVRFVIQPGPIARLSLGAIFCPHVCGDPKRQTPQDQNATAL